MRGPPFEIFTRVLTQSSMRLSSNVLKLEKELKGCCTTRKMPGSISRLSIVYHLSFLVCKVR